MKLLFFCLLCSLPLCALDREAFTFTQYDLHAQADPVTHGFGIQGKIVLRNDSDQPQRNPVLQISSSLDWKSIQVNGKPVLQVSHAVVSDVDHTGQLSESVVTLPPAIPPQGTVELEVSYAGLISKDSTRLEQAGMEKDLASASDWDEIAENFSAVRGVGFVAWYPVALNPVSISDGSSYSLVLQRWKNREVSSQFKLDMCTAAANPKGTVAVFGASVQAPARQSAGTKAAGAALSCASFPAVTVGFTTPSFVLGALARRDLTAEGTNASIVHPPAQAQAAGDYASWMKPAEALVSTWFGKGKRPVLLVALPDPRDAPWESGEALFAPLGSDAKAAQSMLAHQFTHAAFPSPRLWIYEGLAHLAQALEHEREGGRAAALSYMAQQLPTLVEDENENIDIAKHMQSGPISIKLTSLITGSDEVLYRSKAMYVWWMLRDMLGDELLKRALAKYQPAGDTDPAYLQHLLEAEAQSGGLKLDLGPFFNDWVYRDRGLPDFHVPATYARPIESSNATGGFLVTVTVENSGFAGAEVPLTVTTATKETIEKRLLVPSAGKASLRITTQGRPEAVSVNDGSVPESETKNNTANIQIDSSSH